MFLEQFWICVLHSGWALLVYGGVISVAQKLYIACILYMVSGMLFKLYFIWKKIFLIPINIPDGWLITCGF